MKILTKFTFKALLVSLSLTTLVQAKLYRPLDDLNANYYYDSYGKTAKQVQSLSLKEYQDFVDMEVNSPELNYHYNVDSNKPQFLSVQQASKALQAASINPVVSLYQYNKYDPREQGIGFCFGRAMFVDLYLAINNVNRGSIKKAFVVGSMTSGGSQWGWHVTTIVQSQNKAGEEVWLAVDPIVGRVLEVTAWYKEMVKMSDDGKLRLYIAEAGKFSQGPHRYDYRQFNHPHYNKYFIDMLKWFEKNDVSRDLGL